jgi:hypothetical protein
MQAQSQSWSHGELAIVKDWKHGPEFDQATAATSLCQPRISSKLAWVNRVIPYRDDPASRTDYFTQLSRMTSL